MLVIQDQPRIRHQMRQFTQLGQGLDLPNVFIFGVMPWPGPGD